MISRRDFLKISAAGLAALYVSSRTGSLRRVFAKIPGGTLDPLSVPKYKTPLLIPPVMPKAATVKAAVRGKNVDYYEISMRQFQQQILPAPLPKTTVWGYGAIKSESKNGLLLHNAPSLTIEAQVDVPVRVKWINELVDEKGNFLPHLLPVDPTLHWANPPGGLKARDTRPIFVKTPEAYEGPVPIVTHLHGAVGVGDESDGYAEAWFLPNAKNIPSGYARRGSWYSYFASKAHGKFDVIWGTGSATFEYPNANRASTIWYHDHALGMTRLNVYAGPAGFYIVRGGSAGDDAVKDSRTGKTAVLPGPAPKANDSFPPPAGKTYYEIPIAIQDRAFNKDGSLFYPDTRAFFDEYLGPYLPDSDIAPIWNPEFFGNMIMVNGNTWPYQTVEQRRYRIRFLNGCQSRFLILDFSKIPGVKIWQIGNEGGFLPAPVDITALGNRLLMGLAERADMIIDFSEVKAGNYVLRNLGPDEPFGGGEPEEDFDVSDPNTTGQIMQFRVVPAKGEDPTTPPQFLKLPPIQKLTKEKTTRHLALIEMMSRVHDGPAEAMLGSMDNMGMPMEHMYGEAVTENPGVGDTEVWEFYNTTADAHPMHVHAVVFEVINREGLVLNHDGETRVPVKLTGEIRPPEPWEAGFKDTVIAYPGEVTRIRAKFDVPGQFVWHCHIVEHEDNEMMRPYRIGPEDRDAPKPKGPNNM